MRGRQVLAMLLAVAVVVGIPACSGSSATPPQRLTDTQAQQLSLARFTTFRLGTVTLTASFTTAGTAAELSGWVDYPASVAYAISNENGEPRNLLIWSHHDVALAQINRSVTSPPLPQPALDSSWATARIDTTQSELQQILIVIISLGADRPDNALLVAQNGARFVRTDKIAGKHMNVYAVPPNPAGAASSTGRASATDSASKVASVTTREISYWISDTGAIRRAEFTLTSGTDVTINLGTGGGPQLRDPFAAAPTPTG